MKFRVNVICKDAYYLVVDAPDAKAAEELAMELADAGMIDWDTPDDSETIYEVADC